MKNLKDNIWIECFDKMKDLSTTWNHWKTLPIKIEKIYFGKTSSISEELAIKCVKYYFLFDRCYDKSFKNYEQNDHTFESNSFYKTAIESIQSACSQEYCIIFRK
jgi:hypothetical protein